VIFHWHNNLCIAWCQHWNDIEYTLLIRSVIPAAHQIFTLQHFPVSTAPKPIEHARRPFIIFVSDKYGEVKHANPGTSLLYVVVCSFKGSYIVTHFYCKFSSVVLASFSHMITSKIFDLERSCSIFASAVVCSTTLIIAVMIEIIYYRCVPAIDFAPK